MFYLPEEYNTQSYGKINRHDELQEIEQELKSDEGDADVINLNIVRIATILLPDWETLENVEKAQNLYCLLIPRIALSEN